MLKNLTIIAMIFNLTSCATYTTDSGSKYVWIKPLPSATTPVSSAFGHGVTTSQFTVNGRGYNVTTTAR